MTNDISTKKTIAILAKSIKHHEYCVAGKDIISKRWIRAVADENGSALSKEKCKCTYNDRQKQGKPPYDSNILQRVEIEFLQHAPLKNQPENYIVSGAVWLQKYKIELNELRNYLDTPEMLWDEGDRITYSLIENNTVLITQSLHLVEVSQLNLYVIYLIKDELHLAIKIYYL